MSQLNDKWSGYGWDQSRSVQAAVVSQSCYDHDHIVVMGLTLRLVCIDMLLGAMIKKDAT